ncbi:TldD/PmbA family protein, partial [Patescibacteria group bacterium]
FRGQFATQGWEAIEEMDLLRNAPRIGKEAVDLLAAQNCPEGEFDIIIDSNQLALQVHESCGHPVELDRALGFEAGYAGTSFLTPDKLNQYQYGSKQVNIVADATVPGGLGTYGWDDEGVVAKKIDLIKRGKFVGYLTSRETADEFGLPVTGAMRAQSWSHLPLIRMTNINLLPGKWALKDLIKDTKKGLFLSTNRSWSIDDKRLNFQFGTELAQEVKNGKLGKYYKNPVYSDLTPRFWNSCDAVCNRKSWKVYGTPNCGKGEPGQVMFVGHGTSPARFRKVKIFPGRR